MDLQNANSEQLNEWKAELSAQYEQFKAKALALDLTRGKPATAQLALSNSIEGNLAGDFISEEGIDTRNYGGLDGIAEARALGAELMGAPASNVLAGGNSSLTLMHQTMTIAHMFGLSGSDSAWNKLDSVKFICPVPGYDRHYGVCEHLGIDMLTVPMTSLGPDMDAVEALIKNDDNIRGIWCVPKYSNPTGVTYSDDVVQRIAKLGHIAHKDFRVFWDNAYAVHDLVDQPQALKNIFTACEQEGTQDSVLQFASTSKITFAGSGISFLAASEANLAGIKESLFFITIGPDKINQLRHAKFFAAPNALQEHMKKHAAIVKPKFDCVLDNLDKSFSGTNLGCWEKPEGGYFISFDTQSGLAKKVVKMALDAGVKLTPAGATFPYGKDPQDSNIRIAPTVPDIAQVQLAMEVFIVCVKLASVQKALGE